MLISWPAMREVQICNWPGTGALSNTEARRTVSVSAVVTALVGQGTAVAASGRLLQPACLVGLIT